jgi:hypothetical protein
VKRTIPSPGGTSTGSLTEPAAVRCASAAECWTVGFYGKGGGVALNLMLRWNGRRWAAMRVPQPAGTGKTAQNFLNDVTCVSARNCWAVGQFGKSGSSPLNLVLHWNGRSWSRQFTAQPGGTGKAAQNLLEWVTCTSDRSCWAVGSYGSSGPGTLRNQALHWNGRRWAFVHTPNPAGTAAHEENVLLGARCPAASDCRAVGAQVSTTGSVSHEILHWNGKKWSIWT